MCWHFSFVGRALVTFFFPMTQYHHVFASDCFIITGQIRENKNEVRSLGYLTAIQSVFLGYANAVHGSPHHFCVG